MEQRQLPEGYRVPFHKSLTEIILIAGVPRGFFVMNCSFGLGISIMVKFYFFLLVTFILHMLMVYATKKDPQYFDALKRHINQEKYYDV